MRIQSITVLPKDFTALADEARSQGYQFLDRMKQQWDTGENTFSAPGELIFAAYNDNGDLIAVCGLNRDPYSEDASLGRLRHLYVANAYRRLGIAKGLVTRILEGAGATFSRIRLRTDNPVADAFYVAMGFLRSEDEYGTHEIQLSIHPPTTFPPVASIPRPRHSR